MLQEQEQNTRIEETLGQPSQKRKPRATKKSAKGFGVDKAESQVTKGKKVVKDTEKISKNTKSKSSQGDAASQKDLLKKYFREVRRYPLLTREREHELALQYQENPEQQIAYRLITANLRLVVKIAMEYQSAVVNLMDLIQEGNVGLIKAVAKYDPHKGVRLGSYAQWWIRAYILKYLVNNARLVKVGTTQAQRKLFFSLNKEKNRLKAAGFKPEPTLVAKNLGVGVKEVKEMEKRLSRPDLSMDLPLGDDQKNTVGDLIASADTSAEDQLIGSDLKQRVKFHLDDFSKTLKERERVLWEKRLLSEDRMTLREIGDMFGLTRERARQIEKGMLVRLREFLQQKLPELDEVDMLPAMHSVGAGPEMETPSV